MRAGAIQRGLLLILLLVLFAQLVLSVALKSPTLDEQNHMARGLAYLKTGDLRLSREHPPGVNAWEAWPLLLDPRVRLPLDSPSWAQAEWYGLADQLLWQVNSHPQAMVWATRVPVMWLTVLLVALVWRWTRDLAGGWPALIAVAMLVFDPNILAHGRLTTTDMGLACTTVAAMLALWRALEKSSWGRWVLAGAALGAAQLAKFSALVLIPCTCLIVGLAWIGARRTSRARSAAAWIAGLFVCLGTACLAIWAGYAFSWGEIAALGAVPGPAPAYWAGIAKILQRTGGGTPAFLMGQYSDQGWWTYFPVAFAIKTPLPTLALLAAALWTGGRGLLSRWRERQAGRTPGRAWDLGTACLAVPAAAYWAMAIGGSFDIGYRHILPTLPLLYILAARSLGRWIEGHGAVRVAGRSQNVPELAVCALLLWLAASALSIAPHYLAYFNLLAGGPDGGYRFLVDSNLDWGQDLPGLVRYVEQERVDRIYLSWFGAAHPEAYGLSFHPLPGHWRFGGEAAAYGFNPYAPAPGIYAISASNLQGLTFSDHDLYAWFRFEKPLTTIGHSIRIYVVSESVLDGKGHRQAVVLGIPMAQLSEADRAWLGEVSSVRRYDPATGWIVPAVPLATDEVWFVAPQAPGWGQVVRDGPGYVVVAAPVVPAHPRGMGPVFGSSPEGGYVSMLHHEAPAALARGELLRLAVQWVVERAPHRAAVTFAHMLDGEGRYVTGWDGLTAPATCWQPGDLIYQEYALALPADLEPGRYTIEVGWYDAQSGERWPCAAPDGTLIGNRLLLPEVEIGK
jgi:hypothetical protein